MATIVYFIATFVSVQHALYITPDSSQRYASVKLYNNSRSGVNRNDIVNNTWRIRNSNGKPPDTWPLVLKLDKEIFGFRPGQVSKVMIGVEGFAPRATSGTFWDCDGFFVFSIADKQYFVFVTDFDKLGARINFNYGTYIYPRPGSDNIASGNASTTFDNAGSWTSSDDFPETLGGGDEGNYGRLSAQTHGNNWPIIFELINDDINNTFTFRFSSPKFDGSKNQPLESTYKSSVGTSEDIKLYFSVEAWHSEMIQFESFTVVGIDTGDLDIRNSENYWYFGFILCYNTIVLLCC